MRKTKKKKKRFKKLKSSILSIRNASLNGFKKRLNAQCVEQTLKMKLILLNKLQEKKKENKMKKETKTFQEKLKN
jgi:hypothetical protein